MGRGSYDTASFRFPVRGIDRSMPVVEQAPLTCRDSQNVRAATDKGRQSGAKRPGLAKKLLNAAAGTVNALKVVPRTVVDASAFKGLYETIDENWSTRYRTSKDTDYTTTSDLGEGWFLARGEYIALYREPDSASGGGTGASNLIPITNHRTYMTRVPLTLCSRYSSPSTLDRGGERAMVYMAGAPNSDTQRSFLGINYPTKNSVTMRAWGKPQAKTVRYGGPTSTAA
jgi:hypothetical protein